MSAMPVLELHDDCHITQAINSDITYKEYVEKMLNLTQCAEGPFCHFITAYCNENNSYTKCYNCDFAKLAFDALQKEDGFA